VRGVRIVTSPGKLINACQYFVNAHLPAAVKCVGGITPGAAQIAARQADKDTREPSARAFALNRFEDFGDKHEI
jgi:hypothetical protein